MSTSPIVAADPNEELLIGELRALFPDQIDAKCQNIDDVWGILARMVELIYQQPTSAHVNPFIPFFNHLIKKRYTLEQTFNLKLMAFASEVVTAILSMKILFNPSIIENYSQIMIALWGQPCANYSESTLVQFRFLFVTKKVDLNELFRKLIPIETTAGTDEVLRSSFHAYMATSKDIYLIVDPIESLRITE